MTDPPVGEGLSSSLVHTPIVSSYLVGEPIPDVNRNCRNRGFEGGLSCAPVREEGLGYPLYTIGSYELGMPAECNLDCQAEYWGQGIQVEDFDQKNKEYEEGSPESDNPHHQPEGSETLVVTEGISLNELVGTFKSPQGTVVKVFNDCVAGICDCQYFIGDMLCQLKPCRFAAVVCEGSEWAEPYVDLLWFITEGFPIVEGEIPSYHCSNYKSILDLPSKLKMDKIIKRELEEGVIQETLVTPHCVHALGAVPKQDGGIRPITDCSRPDGDSVNNFCGSLFKEFSYKSVDDVVKLLTWGNHMSVIDIKSAYRAVPIKEDHRKYMGFQWEVEGVRKTFLDNRLSFGLRLGPQYFQYISNFVHDILWFKHGIKAVNYLDDFITVCTSYNACLEAQSIVLSTLRALGFHIAYDKVSPPSTCTTYLGVEIDSVCMELRLPEVKIVKLRALLDMYVSRDKITKKDLESLGGLLSHCAHLVRGGKTFCRRLYNLYKELCGRNLRKVRIPPEVKSDLNWWRVFCVSFNGVSQINNVDYCFPMVSDASFKGFGVYLDDDWVAGNWSEHPMIELKSHCDHIGSSPVVERDFVDFRNINVLELWPIVVGLKRWAQKLRNKTLTLFTDNTQVMHMLIKGSSTNPICMSWIREIYWVCVFNNIELRPKYINTHNNLVADTLSRLEYFSCAAEIEKLLGGSNLCCLSDLLVNYRSGRVGTKGESDQI